MFFEGPEKKLELWVRPPTINLRSFRRPFWTAVVEKARTVEMPPGALRVFAIVSEHDELTIGCNQERRSGVSPAAGHMHRPDLPGPRRKEGLE
jgi:hypothetical protein